MARMASGTKAVRRFWLDPQEFENDELKIDGDLYHHLIDVCRFEIGDKFELLQTGAASFVEMIAKDKRTLTVRRRETRPIQAPPRPYIHLALSVPRFPKVDWIVEKSVELGIYAIHPFVSEYSFVRKVSEVSEGKIDRWRKLVRQAAQQSGRGELMAVEAPLRLPELLGLVNQKPKSLCLFPYEGECQFSLKQRLKGVKPHDFDDVWVFVGSEGGFSRAEVDMFKKAGIEPVSLGPQVLRVETACLALASILKYEFEVAEHGSI